VIIFEQRAAVYFILRSDVVRATFGCPGRHSHSDGSLPAPS